MNFKSLRFFFLLSTNILCKYFLDSDDDCLNNGQNLTNLFKSSMNRIDNTHATFLNCLRDWNDPFLLGRAGNSGANVVAASSTNNKNQTSSTTTHHQQISNRSLLAHGLSASCQRCESCACRSLAALAAAQSHQHDSKHHHHHHHAASSSQTSANTTLAFNNSYSTANTSLSAATTPVIYYFLLIKTLKRSHKEVKYKYT